MDGTPKSSIIMGFSIINHPFWGTPILETPISHLSDSRSQTPLTNPWVLRPWKVFGTPGRILEQKSKKQRHCYGSGKKCITGEMSRIWNVLQQIFTKFSTKSCVMMSKWETLWSKKNRSKNNGWNCRYSLIPLACSVHQPLKLAGCSGYCN